MADESRIEVDTTAINALFSELEGFSNKDATKAVRSALRDSASILRKAVYSGLSGISTDRAKRKGVKTTVYKSGKGARVDIFQGFWLDTPRGRQGFSLKWLERGTNPGKRHGATPAKPFFESSVRSGESAAIDSLSNNIIKRINQIADKKR